jgi:hypothetical protein
MAAIASTILVRWRWNSARLLAPRQLAALTVAPSVQPWPVWPSAVLPSVNVVKKFSTLKLATLTLPPTGAGVLVRELAIANVGDTVGWIL